MTKSNEYRQFLRILSDKQVEDIHNGTMSILQKTGVKVCDTKTLQQLADAGCDVDLQAQTARIPEHVAMGCLEQAQSSFLFLGRDAKQSPTVKAGGPFIACPAPGNNIIDLDTWETRTPTRKEYYDYMRLIDALPNYDAHTCFPFGGFEGVPDCMKLLEGCAAKFRVSTKPNSEGSVGDAYMFNTKMAVGLGQDLWQLVNPTAPLTFLQSAVNHIKHFAKHDMPFSVCSGPTLGLTGPATIAGNVAVNNADIIAANVIARLTNPKSRIWAGSMMMSVDMKTASPVFGNVANFLTESAFHQMWVHYGLPTLCNMPGWSNSKMIDYQAGYEMSIAATMSVLSGASFLAYGGGLTAELSGHPVKAVIDNDVIGMLKRTICGIEVSERTLALDVIHEVGFAPNNYLGEMHTLERWKDDIYMPEVADTLGLGAWIATGKKTIIDHARERMEEILGHHKIPELSPAQENMIEDILNEARLQYRSQGLISDDEWRTYMRQIASENYPYA